LASFLFVVNAVFFAAEIPTHETVLAVSAIKKEVRIATGMTIHEISTVVAAVCHEGFVEELRFFDSEAVAAIFVVE
jgi:hypothetical protein